MSRPSLPLRFHPPLQREPYGLEWPGGRFHPLHNHGNVSSTLLKNLVNIGVSGFKIDEVDGFDSWLWPDVARFLPEPWRK